MKLRFTPRAAQDIVDIANYIRAENPPAAERVRASILESLQNLALFPHMGRAQTVAGIRKLVTRKYGYFVYYLPDQANDELIILTIRHPARSREFEDK